MAQRFWQVEKITRRDLRRAARKHVLTIRLRNAMNASQFVSRFQNAFQSGKALKAGIAAPILRRKISPAAPKALLFSPHPDDECIIGGLALRLANEAKWNVINVAVTLGSKRSRQAARLCELKNACAVLGFGLLELSPRGLENITPETRKKDRRYWHAAVKKVAAVLHEQKPRVIFLPHADDGHPAHIGTHWLVMDALKTLPKTFRYHVVETEFWGEMAKPNLLVESSVDDVARLVAALAQHVGEVRRNPYHARLPAWMLDNVRRGAEKVGARGGASPNFIFGTIYKSSRWQNGKLISTAPCFLSTRQSVATLFAGK